MTHLDTLYSELTKRTGLTRVRDVRLEQIAADRALEARYQVGTSGTTGITHPLQQLQARTIPLHPTASTAVGENALWHFYPESWADPIMAMVDATLPDGTKVGWWNSTGHRNNLINANFTHWGIALHYEDVSGGSRRWYAITIFTRSLRPLTRRRFSVAGGEHTGHQFTARGEILGSKTVPIAPRGSGASYDERHDIPGRGPHLHVVNGAWANYWLPESASIQAATIG